MSTTLVGPELETPPDVTGGRGGFPGNGPRGDDDSGGGLPSSYDSYQTGIWVLLIPIVMFFVGLSSSLVVRRGMSDDWVPIQIPNILVANTLILLASSFTFEKAKRAMSTASEQFRSWLWITTGLGTIFLLGQFLAWKQLVAQGVFVSSNPSSSFFYVLTATHGAHLLGGMAALLYLSVRLLRNEFTLRRRSALKATAVFWHFMDALWIYLLFLLIFWR